MAVKPRYWPRAIILVDMNAFFASIEQLDHPEWQGQAIAVTNGQQGTTIITCSYEARAWGVKTGMRLKQARLLCPQLIQAPTRPERYAAVSTRIMRALVSITPDIEVFSVDEAFLDVTRCQSLWGSPESIARQVRQVVLDTAGVLCSVGVSGDKTTAKYAAKLHKPDGLTVIPPWESEAILSPVPVTELCGIGHGIGGYLAERQVFVCGDMKHLPMSELSRRFGNPGRRIWWMAQGLDPEPIIRQVPAPKSMGHGKVMPPNTRDKTVILMYCQHMSEKLAARLRQHRLQAKKYFFGLRTADGWLKSKVVLPLPMNDGHALYQSCVGWIDQHWQGQGVHQIQVTALDPAAQGRQLDLFATIDEKQTRLNQVMDAVNQRYGEFTLCPSRLLQRSSMPNVIAPAWKPDGHRQTIDQSGSR